jgi:hypothetical protein
MFGFKKKKSNRYEHDFTDEDRNLSLERRRVNAELRNKKNELELLRLQQKTQIEEMKLERERLKLERDLQDLKDEVYGYEDYEEQTPDSLMMTLLSTALLKGQHPPSDDKNLSSPEQPSNDVVLSREQIKAFYDGLSKTQKKLIKGLPDNEIQEAIKQKIPRISKESLNLCLEVVKQN